MTKEQILNETYLNPKWFRLSDDETLLKEIELRGNVTIDKDFSSNHHLVYLSDNIKDNCFIKDTATADIADCPNCSRVYK